MKDAQFVGRRSGGTNGNESTDAAHRPLRSSSSIIPDDPVLDTAGPDVSLIADLVLAVG